VNLVPQKPISVDLDEGLTSGSDTCNTGLLHARTTAWRNQYRPKLSYYLRGSGSVQRACTVGICA
jgi:hypothetical protein